MTLSPRKHPENGPRVVIDALKKKERGNAEEQGFAVKTWSDPTCRETESHDRARGLPPVVPGTGDRWAGPPF